MRVVVTGLGGICALGNKLDEIWQKVLTCKSGIEPLQGFDQANLRFKNVAQVKHFIPEDHFSQKELMLLDKFSQLMLVSTREAVNDSGIIFSDESKNSTCIITGCSIGGQDTQDTTFHDLLVEKKQNINPLSIPRIMPNAAASNISMLYGITGPTYNISTACSSGNHAIGNAFWMVRNGMCKTAITGGSETPISYGFLKAWDVLRVISPDTCRPFSKNRQGMILGEGAATLILESLETAIERKAKIYAEVVGFGMSSDAGHITKPSQHGPEMAMRAALQDANLSPTDIGYINAHGTGTLANDPMEISAIKTVFGEHAGKLAVSSTKSLHGHLLGGTGAIEALITIKALDQNVLPPTANFTEPDESCDLDVVPNAARTASYNYSMSNSFAFGGLNASIVFKKWVGKEEK